MHHPPLLHVTLTLGAARVAPDAPIPATVTITNVGQAAVRVNRRLLAAYESTIDRDLYFDVTRDGQRYLGTDTYEQKVRAKALDAHFYETLAPGASIRRDLDLHDLYHFPTGGYRVRAVYAPQTSPAGNDAWAGTARSDEVTLDVR